jgi:uncharacterized membrane protein
MGKCKGENRMKKHVLPLIFILATLIIWLVFYPQLPGQIPIHWDIGGNANGFASKLNAMLMSISSMLLIYGIMVVTPRIDPKKENYKKFSKGFTIINLSLLLLFFAINLMIILSGLGYDTDIGIVIPLIVGALFIVLGNYMPQIKPNYFVGIKTPWTLNDEQNWKLTHRFGGKTFIISGSLFMISVLLPDKIAEIVIFPGLLIFLLLPIGYSYLLFRKQMHNQ